MIIASNNASSKKLWRGKSRLAKRFIGPKWRRELLEWALTVKVGDYIGTCNGCNRQVAEVDYVYVNEGEWVRGRPNRTRVLLEVEFTDTTGGYHVCPGGGCAFPRESIQQIEEYYRDCILKVKEDPSWLEWDNGSFEKKLTRMERAFMSGRSIVDANGEFLPEIEGVELLDTPQRKLNPEIVANVLGGEELDSLGLPPPL